MGIWTRVVESCSNPFVWIAVAALAFTAYDNHRRSQEIIRVCALTGPHEILSPNPRTPREEIDNICIGRQPLSSTSR